MRERRHILGASLIGVALGLWISMVGSPILEPRVPRVPTPYENMRTPRQKRKIAERAAVRRSATKNHARLE